MWKLDSTEDIVRDHAHWYARYPNPVHLVDHVSAGCVIVTEAGGGPEVG
jgi:hypothetical protein